MYKRMTSRKLDGLCAFRVTKSYDELSKFVTDLSNLCDKLIVYEHVEDGKRTHIHALMEGFQKSDETFRRMIKKELNVVQLGNGEFSRKKADDYNFITYMAKGKLTPSYVKGFTFEDISSYKAKWVDPSRTNKKKVTEPTRKEMLEEMIDVYRRMKQDDPEELSPRLIASAVLKVLRKHRVLTSFYKIRDFIQTIDMLEHGDTKNFLDKILSMSMI